MECTQQLDSRWWGKNRVLHCCCADDVGEVCVFECVCTRQTDRQTDRQTNRQIDKQTDSVHIHLCVQVRTSVYNETVCNERSWQVCHLQALWYLKVCVCVYLLPHGKLQHFGKHSQMMSMLVSHSCLTQNECIMDGELNCHDVQW